MTRTETARKAFLLTDLTAPYDIDIAAEEWLYSLPQKLVAEFTGTFALVFIASGAVCADGYVRTAAPNGAAAALLSGALAYGLAAGFLVTAFAHISGGHLNPAITVGFWVTKRLGTIPAILYCVTQLLGSLAAAYLLSLIVPETVWRPAALGTTDLALDFTRINGMVLEGVTTFFVVLAFFSASVDLQSAFRNLAGLPTGFAIAAGALVAGPFTGASMNPARTFGPALVARHWINHGVYWVGPLFGGVLAGVLYERIFLGDQPPT